MEHAAPPGGAGPEMGVTTAGRGRTCRGFRFSGATFARTWVPSSCIARSPLKARPRGRGRGRPMAARPSPAVPGASGVLSITSGVSTPRADGGLPFPQQDRAARPGDREESDLVPLTARTLTGDDAGTGPRPLPSGRQGESRPSSRAVLKRSRPARHGTAGGPRRWVQRPAVTRLRTDGRSSSTAAEPAKRLSRHAAGGGRPRVRRPASLRWDRWWTYRCRRLRLAG